MNISGSMGESSCKRQENGDETKAPERPLKKARFAWQVKGKYHLKTDSATATKTTTTSSNEADRSCTSLNPTKSSDLVGNTEQNLEILGDYLLKQDFNTLDSGSSLLKPSTSLTVGHTNYPRYNSSYDNKVGTSMLDKTNENYGNVALPLSAVISQTENQCIARWQAKQTAKAFVDNTINHVLDSWMVAPLPADVYNNRFLALDVADFINNLPGDNSVENEGILMAISAHGLQNASSSNEAEQKNNILSKEDIFPSPPSSPVNLNEDCKISLNNTNENELCSSANDLDLSWTFDETVKEISSSSDQDESNYNSFSENNFVSNIDESEMHFNFMEAAVSFAIQYKGLTSFGTDYG